MSVRLSRAPAAALARDYDLAIIGGGISGVSLAREASGRGLKVLLVEQDDFGSGTSAATTKFLHGGIRYLEHGDVSLVRECLRERRYLAQAAPHLIRRVELVMPAHAGRDPSMAKLALGCTAYDLLGWDRNRELPAPLHMPATQRLDAAAVRRSVPFLDDAGLRGGWVTHDYQNLHPERLLLELLKSAVALGAVALNHVRALAPVIERRDGRQAIAGLELEDRLDGRRHAVRVRAVVDAAGPWTGELLRRQSLPLPFSIRRVKGIHLLVPRLGGDDVRGVYTRVASGKHVVIAPWQGMHFIGPTDTVYDGPADALHPLQADLDDLLGTLNAALKTPLDPACIRKITVGVRPLIDEPGRDTAAVSRRHRVYDSAELGIDGLYAAAGGKWSASRALAFDVLEKLRREPRLQHVAWRAYDSTRDGMPTATAGRRIRRPASPRPPRPCGLRAWTTPRPGGWPRSTAARATRWPRRCAGNLRWPRRWARTRRRSPRRCSGRWKKRPRAGWRTCSTGACWPAPSARLPRPRCGPWPRKPANCWAGTRPAPKRKSAATARAAGCRPCRWRDGRRAAACVFFRAGRRCRTAMRGPQADHAGRAQAALSSVAMSMTKRYFTSPLSMRA